MNKMHNVNKISFDGPYICLFVDGEYHKIDLRKQSKELANSPDKVKYNYKISPSGYGIHWPDIDEDLSIKRIMSNSACHIVI